MCPNTEFFQSIRLKTRIFPIADSLMNVYTVGNRNPHEWYVRIDEEGYQ